MDGLVEWLRECLDKIEQVALEGDVAGEWSVKCGQDLDVTAGIKVWVHAGMHGPRAVIARVQAERALLDLHDGPVTCSSCADDGLHAAGDGGAAAWPCATVRVLAYGHRHDAPGYDPAWAPEGVTAATG